MTVTKNGLLQLVLNERFQNILSMTFLASVAGIIIVGCIEIIGGVRIPSEAGFIIGMPFIVGLMGTVFLGGPILHLMAEHENNPGSKTIMRRMGNFFTFVASIGILAQLEQHVFSVALVQEIDALPYLLKMGASAVIASVIALAHHSIVKSGIKKLLQL